jgi:iron-sulfur cluster assembly accessory protein
MTAARFRYAAVPVIAILTLGCRERPDPISVTPAGPADVSEAVLLEGLPVTVSPRAAEEVRHHLEDLRGHGRLYLRLRVLAGGCQGFMHKLDLDPTVTADDHVFESSGVRVAIARRQLGLLRGTVVDFGEKDGKKGFMVENPNFKGESTTKSVAALTGDGEKE